MKNNSIHLSVQKEPIMEGELTGYASIDKPWLKYYDEKKIKIALPEKTLFEYLYENNSKHTGRIALNYFGNKIEFKVLFNEIEKVAKAFSQLGVKKGDIVSICTVTTPEIIASIYALNKLGAIVNLIDPRTSKEGIARYVNEVDSKILLLIGPLYDIFKGGEENTSLDKIIVVNPLNSLPLMKKLALIGKNSKKTYFDKYMSWEDFKKLSKNVSTYETAKYEKNKPAIIVHTGGTTGVPKGVVLSNDNLNAMAHQYRYSGMDLQPGHKFLNIITPSFAYGVSNSIHLPLSLGMTDVIIPKFDPNSFDEYLLKYKPNHTLGVPRYWEELMKSEKLKNKKLDFLYSAGCGGEHMEESLEEEISEYLKQHNSPSIVAKGYGMTEVSSAACICMKNCNKVGSVGVPFINNTISIFDSQTGEEKKYNEIGEICINTPTLMLGYYNNDEETNKIVKIHSDGEKWIHTGDLGYITEDGMIYVKGRIKRMIIKRGLKIFPSEIERVIKLNKWVDDCCVVGSFDNEFGTVPRAHIRFKEEVGDKVDQELENIYQLCKQNLPEYSIPSDFIVDEEPFPLTLMAKIDYKVLEQRDNEKYKKLLKDM